MPDVYLPPLKVERIVSQLSAEFVDYGIKLIGADKVWSKYTGRGFKLAILDTGIDFNHLDLKDNIAKANSFVPGENSINDSHGHGTHCSGIAAGNKNGIGIIGTAPDVALYPGKVLNSNGQGSFDWITNAVRWAIKENVDVISMSLGTFADLPQDLVNALKDAHNNNIFVIVAAGNEGPYGPNTLSSFARLDFTISVGAVDQEKGLAGFSSIGEQLDYVAPGVGVYSCFPNNSYAKLSGTSMATPYVAGLTCLFLEYFKNKYNRKPTFNELVNSFNSIAQDLGSSGFDKNYGNGLICIDRILYTTPDPEIKYYRVQIGAFTVQENAIRLRDKIKSMGINAITKYYKPYYKVQVGAYSERKNAEATRDKMRNLGFKDAFIFFG